LETGQPLRAVDLQELSYAVGKEATIRLQRAVDEDAAVRAALAARRARKRRGFWHWFAGPIQDTPEVPVEIARLLARVRDGQPLIEPDDPIRWAGQAGRGLTRALTPRGVRLVGRASARAIARQATRHPARARAATRQTGQTGQRPAGPPTSL
jgi:hypothetical protein